MKSSAPPTRLYVDLRLISIGTGNAKGSILRNGYMYLNARRFNKRKPNNSTRFRNIE
jgi:hypothetical protein